MESLEIDFEVVDREDAAVADSATLAGGEDFDVSPSAVKVVAQGDDVVEADDGSVGFPDTDVDRVAGIEDCTGR